MKTWEEWQNLKPKCDVPAALAAHNPPTERNPHHSIIAYWGSCIVNGVILSAPSEEDLVMHLLAIEPRCPHEYDYDQDNEEGCQSLIHLVAIVS